MFSGCARYLVTSHCLWFGEVLLLLLLKQILYDTIGKICFLFFLFKSCLENYQEVVGSLLGSDFFLEYCKYHLHTRKKSFFPEYLFYYLSFCNDLHFLMNTFVVRTS